MTFIYQMELYMRQPTTQAQVMTVSPLQYEYNNKITDII